MKRAYLLALLTTGCGMAVVGDRCPGLEDCEVAADLDVDGQCPPGQERCGDRCADPLTDPDHCGGCSQPCDTGLCRAGSCEARGWGHVVLVGHDYQQPRVNEGRELANAVFLSLAATVRVAIYGEHASPTVTGRTLAALTTAAEERGRAVASTTYHDRAAFAAALGAADVALVVAQDQGSDAALDQAAGALLATLQGFTQAGGVLVVLDGPAANAGTWQLVRGLIPVAGAVEVTGTEVEVVVPTDALAIGLTVRYRAAARTVAFAYAGPGEVARAPTGPVLIHEAVTR